MRAIAIFGLVLLTIGCGSKDNKPVAESSAPAGKPAADEAKTCIVAYLNQCGWKDVELSTVAEQQSVPAEAKSYSESWAFGFTANYTNVVGEHLTSANWIAVVTRTDGKCCVKCCFDDRQKLVGGSAGTEAPEKVALTPQPPADDLPAIIAPKP